jgi:delta14-sterol reductase
MSSGSVKKPFSFGYGAIPLMVLLPPLVYYMWWCMINHDGAMVVPGWDFVKSLPAPTLKSVLMYGGWFGFHALLQIYAPGEWVHGTPLKDGRRLKYKMNGWFTWWATWVVIAAIIGIGAATGGRAGALGIATVLYDEFGPLMSTVNIFTFVFVVYLYIEGKRRPDDGEAVQSGNPAYDYFMGTSLNPRLGLFDWKLFCEARPGLIGWVAINLSLMAKQYEVHGTVSAPMLMVVFFHGWYIADYYLHEEAILTTWDIKHENFGWMLCWGDLVWVPFTYTLQALYLLRHPDALPSWAIGFVVVLNFAGFCIFRGTNIQKHYFRKDPDKPLRWWGVMPEYIETSTGSRLLTNGFWGWARHLNYLGDLMMALAWCLTCGFDHLLPYFYIIYFTILLVHRERRDHMACAEKYGEDWEAYCAKVKWRILPGVY